MNAQFNGCASALQPLPYNLILTKQKIYNHYTYTDLTVNGIHITHHMSRIRYAICLMLFKSIAVCLIYSIALSHFIVFPESIPLHKLKCLFCVLSSLPFYFICHLCAVCFVYTKHKKFRILRPRA